MPSPTASTSSTRRYVRGSTLRLLCKLHEPQLLEPLVASIKGCLTHRHPYVRRNAVLAVFSLFKHNQELYPDAPDDIEKLLEDETDAGTRRNAFVMMFQVAPDRALAFLAKNIERVRVCSVGGSPRADASSTRASALERRDAGMHRGMPPPPIKIALPESALHPPPPIVLRPRCSPLVMALR